MHIKIVSLLFTTMLKQKKYNKCKCIEKTKKKIKRFERPRQQRYLSGLFVNSPTRALKEDREIRAKQDQIDIVW